MNQKEMTLRASSQLATTNEGSRSTVLLRRLLIQVLEQAKGSHNRRSR